MNDEEKRMQQIARNEIDKTIILFGLGALVGWMLTTFVF